LHKYFIIKIGELSYYYKISPVECLSLYNNRKTAIVTLSLFILASCGGGNKVSKIQTHYTDGTPIKRGEFVPSVSIQSIIPYATDAKIAQNIKRECSIDKQLSDFIKLYAEKKGISPDNIMPKMDDTEVFAYEAADVAMEAIKNGVARVEMTWDEVFNRTMEDIKQTRGTIDMMMKNNFIPEPDTQMLEDALKIAIDKVK